MNSGCVIGEKELEALNTAYVFFTTGKEASNYSAAYRQMNVTLYVTDQVIDGKMVRTMTNPNERPSYWQMKLYIQKCLLPEEIEKLKTKAAEVRNNRNI